MRVRSPKTHLEQVAGFTEPRGLRWARSPFCFRDKAPKPWAWAGGWPNRCPLRGGYMIAPEELLGYDLAKLCFEGPADVLDSTIYSQPALFVTSLAALELLRTNRLTWCSRVKPRPD